MSEQNASGSSTPHSRRDDLVAAERDRFGGFKFGAAFFGWLAATGMAVLLAALLSAIGVGVGLASNTDPGQAAEQATQDPTAAGITGAIILAVILLIAYFCGGYVAGRMARFDGAKQGVAVWLWAVVIVIILAVIGLIAGSQFDLVGQLSTLSGVQVPTDTLTTTGIIAVIVAALLALVGAVLGGIMGMRYHRKIDQFGLDHAREPRD
ncbi:hypothetical protein ABDK96_13960 [Citricoccus nitrophenolicus]|uniref:Major facilitator superfamily (MFS) profile domain-containing protein n=1 Tax=Citricoccus nitrophenolicus TaxID=863575 RepID=A0ABV0IMP0_9MICC|nr:hypothetical protein [Citricoccus sp. I39-566]WMY78474.1 hypothetical protein RE421_01030 [Citricoccus sp. I39-566]